MLDRSTQEILLVELFLVEKQLGVLVQVKFYLSIKLLVDYGDCSLVGDVECYLLPLTTYTCSMWAGGTFGSSSIPRSTDVVHKFG